jgi:hypothetical protein
MPALTMCAPVVARVSPRTVPVAPSRQPACIVIEKFDETSLLDTYTLVTVCESVVVVVVVNSELSEQNMHSLHRRHAD